MRGVLFFCIMENMNANDFRTRAYQKASGKKSNGEAGGGQKPFEKSDARAAKAPQQGDEDLRARAEALKQGGLLKVPTESPGADGKESAYRRVAKFLLVIGVDEAAKVLQRLSQEQTEKIIPEIVSIRSVPPEEAKEVLEEFQGFIARSREAGGVETAREILRKAYGDERAAELLQNAAPFAEGRPFEYLNEADSERIYFLLKDESTAIQALVLARINPQKAASVINLMPDDEKKNVASRLARMQPVSPDALRRVDKALHEKSLAASAEKAESVDGRAALAEILKRMSVDAEGELIESISSEDPDLAGDLRDRLFTVQDVVNADDKFLQSLLREMDDKTIALLVAAKDESFRAKIFSNLSRGRGDSVLEEEEIMKPMRKRDCDKATRDFIATLRRAYDKGELRVASRDDDEYVM